ncbi:hypothetical protein CSC94_05100 [Zhengella mangrovi]|uniref:Mechanosensitive ion channel protein MscS n=1 Tax=Zhengella mangrovi TaxID=1982044 RepID=A0A2G1QRG3_9HYPH|nr:hypothetical protein CSC94_05100 [Zhengella mangrovi]
MASNTAGSIRGNYGRRRRPAAPDVGRVAGGVLCFLLPLLLAFSARAADAGNWAGTWETFWREGAAVVMLKQDGDTVTGTYEPGGGRIEGRVEGDLLRGRWIVDDASGQFVFALSGDGQTFTGRFDSGEYWNGRRAGGQARPRHLDAADNPRETLKTLIAAFNEYLVGGKIEALRFAQSFLAFEGENDDTRGHNRRRTLLLEIIELSTFRLYDAPPRPAGDQAGFQISPEGTDVSYTLRFVRQENGIWRLLVEDETRLTAVRDRFLAALGRPSFAAAKEAARHSPRGVMQRFISGVHDWDGPGRAEALSTLDLSFLPKRLHAAEGPVLADYLKQVIDRAGYVFYQEIPNNPRQTTPYVHYTHPLGNIVIARQPSTDDQPDRWAFSAETLRRLPSLYVAMQNLPPAPGLAPQPPLTHFFVLRERVREASPALLHRALLLENWQWIALVLLALIATGAGIVASRFTDWQLHGRQNGETQLTAGQSSLVHAVGLTVASLALAAGIDRIGILETDLRFLYQVASAGAIIGGTWMAYLITGAVGAIFERRALATTSYADEIVTSLAVGIMKLIILAIGLMLLADTADLPYEGVLAGLGVGGIAVAFASRDTVSNMIGGILLMTDHPFKRGDLIEAHGHLATVEAVGLRSTRLKRLDDTIMIIPNSQLSDQIIVNWGLRRRRRVDLSISLTYDTPRERLDTFVQALRDLVLRQPQIDPVDCYVGLKDFSASAIEVECRCFFRVPAYEDLVAARSALTGDIVDLARDTGVQFAYPTRTIHVVRETPEGDRQA